MCPTKDTPAASKLIAAESGISTAITKTGAERMINSAGRPRRPMTESQSLNRYRASSRKPTDPTPMATVRLCASIIYVKRSWPSEGRVAPLSATPNKGPSCPSAMMMAEAVINPDTTG